MAKEIIEINGVKLEIDTRLARRIDELKVGSRVKVLTKGYGDDYKVNHGIVIGFEPFEKLPTIIIAYVEISYSSAEVKFLYYNAKTKDIEIVLAFDSDEAALDKDLVLQQLDREISKREQEIQSIKDKRRYFLDTFNSYWARLEEEV